MISALCRHPEQYPGPARELRCKDTGIIILNKKFGFNFLFVNFGDFKKTDAMKKFFTLMTAGVGLGLTANAQLPVSTAAQNKKVVLEEFTGIHCVWCPDGHKMANDLKASKPAGSVVLVNVHTGGYATPGSGEPDFRTSEGNTIAALPGMGITGYPTGSINRHLFSGEAGMAVSRSKWGQYATDILTQPSYVNVALQGTLDVNTRLLTVNVEAYFTANSTAASNKLTVMLLEDNVAGPQTGKDQLNPSQVNIDGTYSHQHMLRKVLTAAATGETLTTTTSGTLVTKTYTYTVPAQFVNTIPELGNLELAAFVTEGDKEIMTAANGPITLTGFANTKDGMPKAVAANADICSAVAPLVRLYNNGSTTITAATLSYDLNGAGAQNYSFAGTIKPGTSQLMAMPYATFAAQATNTLNVKLLTVNGSADQDATNNNISKANLVQTTKVSNFAAVTMEFTQDQYGSESSWKVYDETNNAVIAQDGPWSDLGAAGTLLHSKKFDINPSRCYRLEVKDSYGDGINSGAGAGKYELKAGGSQLLSSPGTYTTGEVKTFKSGSSLAVPQVSTNIEALNLFPNPAKETATLEFTLQSNSHVNVSIVDMTGRVVKHVTDLNYTGGTQRVNINVADLAAGLYNISVKAEDGQRVTRLSVVK